MSENVVLRRSGNLVEALPVDGISGEGLNRLLREELQFKLKVRHDWETRRATGKRYGFKTCLLSKYKTDNDTPRVVFPAGLLKRTAELLARNKYSYRVEDLRPVLLPSPRLDRLQHDLLKTREDQRKALALMFSSDMGIIACPTAWGKTFLICQLVLAYPESRIIICTYRKDVLKSIYDRVKTVVAARELGMVGGGAARPTRVTCSTIDSLHRAKPETCRLFLYDECHEAAAENRAEKIAMVQNSRVFGFSASHKGRSDGADMMTEAIFGPVLYELPYDEAEAKGRVATIEVKMYPVYGYSVPFDDEVEQYRHGIWRNAIRNQLIAQLAAQHLAEDKQVLIMVDKLEHALHLKRLLPSWPLVHGPTQEEQLETFQQQGLLTDRRWLCDQSKRDMYRVRFEDGRQRCAIATGVWSQGVDMRHLDVLVRGDAKSSEIASTQIPGRLARGEYGLLIDFRDVFDDRFSRRSDTRLRSYKGKGWSVTDIEAA